MLKASIILILSCLLTQSRLLHPIVQLSAQLKSSSEDQFFGWLMSSFLKEWKNGTHDSISLGNADENCSYHKRKSKTLMLPVDFHHSNILAMLKETIPVKHPFPQSNSSVHRPKDIVHHLNSQMTPFNAFVISPYIFGADAASRMKLPIQGQHEDKNDLARNQKLFERYHWALVPQPMGLLLPLSPQGLSNITSRSRNSSSIAINTTDFHSSISPSSSSTSISNSYSSSSETFSNEKNKSNEIIQKKDSNSSCPNPSWTKILSNFFTKPNIFSQTKSLFGNTSKFSSLFPRPRNPVYSKVTMPIVRRPKLLRPPYYNHLDEYSLEAKSLEDGQKNIQDVVLWNVLLIFSLTIFILSSSLCFIIRRLRQGDIPGDVKYILSGKKGPVLKVLAPRQRDQDSTLSLPILLTTLAEGPEVKA